MRFHQTAHSPTHTAHVGMMVMPIWQMTSATRCQPYAVAIEWLFIEQRAKITSAAKPTAAPAPVPTRNDAQAVRPTSRLGRKCPTATPNPPDSHAVSPVPYAVSAKPSKREDNSNRRCPKMISGKKRHPKTHTADPLTPMQKPASLRGRVWVGEFMWAAISSPPPRRRGPGACAPCRRA